MNLLKTNKLSKIYPGIVDVIALNEVNFTMNKGDLTAIIGDSGSGKSTLLHLLAGVDNPTSGKIFIQGEDITKLNRDDMTVFRRRNIGVIYQFFNLIPNISVQKNILLPLLLDGRREDKEYFKEIVSTLGIADKLDRFPNQLSGGEQQRVAIARSLVTKPALILADEPTGNLDRRNSEEITALFRIVNQRFNSTIMIITHDEKVAMSCDKVFKMVDGKLYSLEGDKNENYQ
jgi:putative ABC transport system ATP-binding protein